MEAAMTNTNDYQAFKDLLGDRFTQSPSDRALHGRSESHFPEMPPDAVAYVETVEDVEQIVQLCSAHNIPMIGWGTGTSLEAQAAAPHGGISVDFSRMNKVLHIDTENMLVTVQPGITREALDIELRHTGLFFPVDPGANASIGGMASTRASGTTTVRYGTMRDNVKALQVVPANGRAIRTGSRAKKSSAGYDLTSLFVGAEGTLGLITELTLKLHPRPEAISAGIVAFPDMVNAVDAVIATIQMALPMARIEFVDPDAVRAFNAYSGTTIQERPQLLFELHGNDTSVDQDAETFRDICNEYGGEEFQWSSKPDDRKTLWTMRHNAHYAVLAANPGKRVIVTDICVPIANLAQAIRETRDDIAQSGLNGPMLGHVGDGNFHTLLLIDPEQHEQKQIAQDVSDRMAKRALDLGGTCTGEHGIGIGKKKFMTREHGAAWEMMGTLKHALDPQNIFNPGKLVPDLSTTSHGQT
jgi:D-lactate dehydrogenase (cytochrome)